MDSLEIIILAFATFPIISLFIDGMAQIVAHFDKYSFGNEKNEDFTILVPIYGNTKYLENADYLRQYGQKVILCTTGDEKPEFYQQLQSIADDNGFRIFQDKPANSYGNLKASEQRATSGTIRDRLIRNALTAISTKYVVPLDADTTTKQSISILVGELEAHGWDLASIKLLPSNRNESILSRLQYHEYSAIMRIRYIAPWMLSGACHVAKTEVLRDVMNHHSLFFQGNDMEIGLIGSVRGYKIGHIPFEVSTAVPSKFRSWYRQRMAWAGGEFRLFVTNFRFSLIHPIWWIYGGIVAIGFFPLRWYSLQSPLIPLLILIGSYCLFVIVLHFKTRDRWILIMPFYRMFSSLILTPLGILWYVKSALSDRNYGIIRPGRPIWQSMTLGSKIGAFIVFGVLLTSAIGVAVISNVNNQHSYSLFVVPANTGPNLLRNPSFENGSVEGLANKWYREYSPDAVFSVVTSGVVNGSYAQHISQTGAGVVKDGLIGFFQPSIEPGYGPGDEMTFTIYVSGSYSKCSAIIGIESFDDIPPNGIWISENDSALYGLTNAPQIFGVNYRVPTNSVYVAVFVQFNEIVSQSSIDVTFDNASLVKILA